MIGIFHEETTVLFLFFRLPWPTLTLTKGARKCNHHKQGFPERRFQEENCYIKEDLVQGNFYQRTCLVTRSTCKIRLVTRSTHLTTRSTLSIRSPTHSIGFSTRSTHLSIRSTRLSTRCICLWLLVLKILSVGLLMTNSNIC